MFDTFEKPDQYADRKQLHCNDCKRVTIHVRETLCVGKWADAHPMGEVDGGTDFSLYRCGACDEVCFHKSSWCSEDFDQDADGNLFAVRTETQFPAPTSASFTFNTDYTPTKLNSIIEEMLYAFAGQKVRLATIGLRLIVEFIVNDNNCAGSTLFQKINDLHSSSLVDDDQKKLLHEIRKRGNAGAHEGIAMSPNEIIAGMEVIDLLIEKLYSSPKRHEEVLRRANAAFAPTDDST